MQPLWRSQDPQAENPVMFLDRLTGVTKPKPNLTTLGSQGNHRHGKNPSALKKKKNTSGILQFIFWMNSSMCHMIV